MSAARDVLLAQRARRHGAHYSLRIIREARRADIPISLAFAVIEQESTFRNVYGHDRVANRAPKGGKVTRKNYRDVYLPDRRAGKGMQGVGPAQLTWWELQDHADRAGGCWRPACNIRTAFEHLAMLIDTYGRRKGIVRYNGSGAAAQRYADAVLAKASRWHERLT